MGLEWDRSLGWCNILGSDRGLGWDRSLGGCKSLEGQGSGSWRGQLDMGMGWDRSLGRYMSLGGYMSVGGYRRLGGDSLTWVFEGHGYGTGQGG